jgi:hypothetical protein
VKTTLVVCESPWSTKGRLERWSLRPFVEGLCELYDARLVYRTFTAGDELNRLLNDEAIDGTKGRVLVYLACHGRGGRLQLGRRFFSRPNLATVAESLHPGVEGVWLGACDLGGSTALERFCEGQGGAIWAGGYSCSVDWEPSLVLDIAVLQELMIAGRCERRASVITRFHRAFRTFNPEWEVGVDARDRPVNLRHAIRIVARDRTPGARPKELSGELQRRLRWGGAN